MESIDAAGLRQAATRRAFGCSLIHQVQSRLGKWNVHQPSGLNCSSNEKHANLIDSPIDFHSP